MSTPSSSFRNIRTASSAVSSTIRATAPERRRRNRAPTPRNTASRWCKLQRTCTPTAPGPGRSTWAATRDAEMRRSRPHRKGAYRDGPYASRRILSDHSRVSVGQFRPRHFGVQTGGVYVSSRSRWRWMSRTSTSIRLVLAVAHSSNSPRTAEAQILFGTDTPERAGNVAAHFSRCCATSRPQD